MSRAAPTTGSNRRTARRSWQLRATLAQDPSPKAWKLSRTFLSFAISASTCSKATCSLSQWRRANLSGRCFSGDMRLWRRGIEAIPHSAHPREGGGPGPLAESLKSVALGPRFRGDERRDQSADGYGLPCPRKKYGWEVGRIAAFAMSLRMRRGRSCLRFDATPIEMPRRVAEDRHNDRQAEEQRERSDNKQGSDNKAPQHHRERVAGDRAERCQQRDSRADVAVKQERERHDADAQHQDGKQETHQVADKNKRPSGAGAQHFMDKSFDRSRCGVTERRDVDRIGERYPDHEYGQQQQSQRRDRADRGRLENIESAHRRRREAGFPAPAQFIEAECGDWSDQSEAARQGIEQGQDRVAERQPRQKKADDGINYAEEHGVGRHRVEIVDAFGQRFLQVRNADATDDRLRRTCAGSDQNV